MDIFEFAINMEADGEAYYRELAEKANDSGLATILSMLADQERRHGQILRRMRDETDAEIPAAGILNDAKNVFVAMKEADNQFNFHISQIDLYKKAQEIERKSEHFYIEKAEEVEVPAQREIFNKLAAEEKEHCFLLDNIIEFVSRPQSWLENAEWNHLEEY